MSKSKIIIFLSICFSIIIAMGRHPLIVQYANELKIKYEKSVSGNNSFLIDILDEEKNDGLNPLIKGEKGWLVSTELNNLIVKNIEYLM